MAKILIKNGRVWDGEVFSQVDILTENDRILKMQADICGEAEFVFDAAGKIVSAGFVDAHVHMKGISSDEFGIDAQMSTLPFGVTAAADASGVQGDRARLNSFGIKNCVFVCADFKDNKACFDNALKMMEIYGDKAVGIKVYFDRTISPVWDIKPLQEVVSFAEEHELIIMVHSSYSPVSMRELLQTLRKGDILTHAYHTGENNVSEDNYECIHEAKKRGVIIDAGLAGHVHTDFSVFQNAIACGALPDVISTDITKYSAYKRGGRYGLTMCMSIGKYLGMKEEDIFRAVTSAPAKVLGKDDLWGSLKVGRTADIAVLEYTDEGFEMTDKAGNHICSEKGYRNVLTIADGEVVYRR